MYVNVEQIFPLNPQTRVKETLHVDFGTMFLKHAEVKKNKKCLPDGGPNSNMAVSLEIFGGWHLGWQIRFEEWLAVRWYPLPVMTLH